jgi:ATP phosphoribosyltransferase regulatory subunit
MTAAARSAETGRHPDAGALVPPVGMRDLVPPQAGRRRMLGRTIGEVFARHGYAPVTTPPFELERVFGRAFDTIDPRELLRFVDGDSGEVVVMRPDITPQIARVVATRLADRPPPHRLSYEGHVVRRRRGRARTQRQIAQAGVECIGAAGVFADVEVISLASIATAAAGLSHHRIELNLVSLARTLLDHVDAGARKEASEALARKDRTALEAALTGEPAEVTRRLLGALELVGGVEVLDTARKLFEDAPSRALIDTLARVHEALARTTPSVPIGFDLGEPRGFGYYTGVSFALLAEGPGEPIATGGRYDDLLARFGTPMPATGAGIDLDHLEWALDGASTSAPARSVVAFGEGCVALASELRASGYDVATLPDASAAGAEAYARAWSHAAIVSASDGRVSAMRVLDGASATESARAASVLDRLLTEVR